MSSKQQYKDAIKRQKQRISDLTKMNKNLELKIWQANEIIKSHQRTLKRLRYKKWWEFWK